MALIDTTSRTNSIYDIISKLSILYNFDEQDACKKLGLINKTFPKSREKVRVEVYRRVNMTKKKLDKIPLPFCGVIYSNLCLGIRYNHGLYTQCNNTPSKMDLCETCYKQSKKNEAGKPNHGLITERGNKNAVRYKNILEKLKISEADALEAAKCVGITIPEKEFEPLQKKRGRPKKNTGVVDTSDEDDDGDTLETDTSVNDVSETLDNDVINVCRIRIGDKTYLLDSKKNIYDVVSHELVGDCR
jgi:hypothetical protein